MIRNHTRPGDSLPAPRARRQHAGIYLVTDPDMSVARHNRQHGTDGTAYLKEAISLTVNLVAEASRCGVRVIQLRWKNADAGPFLDLALAAAEAVAPCTQLIINDRFDVFLAAQQCGAGLAGIHIGQSDLPAELARELVGPDALLGWSASTPAELARADAMADIIDVVGVGVLRNTTTKPDAPKPFGVDGLADVAARSRIPVVAIGGVKEPDLVPLAKTNIYSAAVVSAIVNADDPAATSRHFSRLWADTKAATSHVKERS